MKKMIWVLPLCLTACVAHGVRCDAKLIPVNESAAARQENGAMPQREDAERPRDSVP